MAAGIFVEFDASQHAVVVLLVLRAILVLPLARMPLLKLYCQRATSVLPSCAGVDTKMWALLRSQGANSDSVSIKWFGTGTSCHVQAFSNNVILASYMI